MFFFRFDFLPSLFPFYHPSLSLSLSTLFILSVSLSISLLSLSLSLHFPFLLKFTKNVKWTRLEEYSWELNHSILWDFSFHFESSLSLLSSLSSLSLSSLPSPLSLSPLSSNGMKEEEKKRKRIEHGMYHVMFLLHIYSKQDFKILNCEKSTKKRGREWRRGEWKREEGDGESGWKEREKEFKCSWIQNTFESVSRNLNVYNMKSIIHSLFSLSFFPLYLSLSLSLSSRFNFSEQLFSEEGRGKKSIQTSRFKRDETKNGGERRSWRGERREIWGKRNF